MNKVIFFFGGVEIIGSFLGVLTLWLALFNFIVTPFSKVRSVYIIFLIRVIVILWTAFQRSSLLTYYFFFEVSILPILFLILGWGYQPERISSSFFIFFYTLFGSLPLLIILLYLIVDFGSLNTNVIILHLVKFNSLEVILIFSAFFIKLPLYFTHIWLPKAHVEAPVVGSMILAGLMLKLGGIGLILCFYFPIYINSALIMIMVISRIGGGLTRIIITRLRDMKVIIAYSSVVHIRLVSVSLISWVTIGVAGAVLIIISHGFTSPGIFCGANIIYERSHSRRVLLNKGLLRSNPSIARVWFLLIVLNFGGPFTVNLLSEILLINALGRVSFFLLIWAGIMCFFSLAYNLILYASLNQGVNLNFLLFSKFLTREILILWRIVFPTLIILFRVLV